MWPKHLCAESKINTTKRQIDLNLSNSKKVNCGTSPFLQDIESRTDYEEELRSLMTLTLINMSRLP